MLNLGIVDYGIGNLQSVANALECVGVMPNIVSKPEEVGKCDHVVLPGVGSFDTAMDKLTSSNGLAEALDSHVRSGKPLLGICLGMQLLGNHSEEGRGSQGLGWIDCEVVPIEPTPNLKIPHVGWNSLGFHNNHKILAHLSNQPDVYFVHSYRVKCASQENVIMTVNHGTTFPAMIASGNVVGMQFHPEKSHTIGLQLLKNFLDL